MKAVRDFVRSRPALYDRVRSLKRKIMGSLSLSFWSFAREFLEAQSLEDRLDYLRNASFDRNHVAGFPA